MELVARGIWSGLRWMLVGAVAIALIGGGVALASLGTGGTAAAAVRTDQVRTQADPSVTRDQATAKALEAVPGGTVLSAEPDTERGTTVWQVDVRGTDGIEYEVQVDAGSGAVLGTDRDDD
ncbi:PepSY domain-containing protein [Nocardia blacklockiae]|uniref:PepSY domain-containing protein n=1 Tax=Nocardia blacklockiae TaxID=480036 RepID=UPI001894B910|nr:PepSY domain-containing protein [Nocardia blacklockiae]MBF6170757.1 PepSY domain-containing protein [Nocardia blacklockiae]